MDLATQTLALGILIGGLYALQALGLTLIFGVVRIANFAHGALFTLGGYGAYVATLQLHLPAAAGVVAGTLVGASMGYLISAVPLRPVSGGTLERPGEYALIVTFAISLLVGSAVLAVFGGFYHRPPGFWSEQLTIGEWIRVSGDRVVAFGAAIALIAALVLVLRSTDTGRAWRALAQSRLGAQVVGVDVRALSNRAFATSGALAGASAALVAPILSVYPASGDSVLIKSFIAVIIGGLGSVPGSLVGGLLLGLVEAFGSVYVSSAYTDAYGFLIMAGVLLLRPTGLFGRKVRLV